MSMTVKTSQMRTLFGIVFSALLMCGKMLIVGSTVYPSQDTSLEFPKCLIEKMSATPYFTSEDRKRMIEMYEDALAETLRNNVQASFPGRRLVIAFTTSLPDIVIHDNVELNNYRKRIYSSVLEQCSLWFTGNVDTELIREAQRILSDFENSKAKKYEKTNEFTGVEIPVVETLSSVSHFQTSGVDRQFAVQPSPVQTPYARQYFHSNDKTFFQQQQKSNSPFPVASDVDSQYETRSLDQMSSDTGVERQLGSFPQRYDLGNTRQTSEKSDGISDVSSYNYSPQISPINQGITSHISFGGLSIPQTKESSVVAIPPKTNQQYISNKHSSQNTEHETIEQRYLPPSLESVPKSEKSDFSRHPSTVTPQTQEQYSDVTSYPDLENIIFNILLNSETFKTAYNFEASQETAINLARTITRQTFAGYDLNLTNDALSVVTAEVAEVRVPTPDNVARALSTALVSVLKMHDTLLPAERSQLASSFLFNLDNSGKFNSQPGTTDAQFRDSYNGETIPSESNEKKTDFDFQSPPLSPEDRKDEIFSLTLAQYLSNSEIIRNFFCGKSEDIVPLFSSVIKFSLTEFSQQVASLASSIASGALSELHERELCNNYAITISEVVAEILEEKGIANVNAEKVSKNMELNLNQRQITLTQLQQHSTVSYNFPPRTPKDRPYTGQPNLESSFISVEEINPRDQANTRYSQLTLLPDNKDVSDYKNTYTSTSLSPIESTTDSDSYYWAPNGIIEQKILANDLSRQFEDLLRSYNSKESECEDLNDEEISDIPETSKQYETDDYDISKEELNRNSYTRSENKEKSSTFQLHTSTTFSDQSEIDEENYRSSITEKGDQIFYRQDEGEIDQQDKFHLDPIESKVKIIPVELQPSFQDPTFYSEVSSQRLQPNSERITYDAKYSPSQVEMARQISETAKTAIHYIHSEDINNFNRTELCARLNQLAPMVNIPTLDYCENIAAIDYLLHVLIASFRI